MARALVALGFAILEPCLSAQALAAPPEIAVFITVQPAAFAYGDTVTITVEAQNPGDTPVEYGLGSSSCRLDAVVRADGVDFPVFAPRACLKDYRPWILAPGERRRESWRWTGAVAAHDTTYQLNPGTYELRGAAGPFLSVAIVLEIEK